MSIVWHIGDTHFNHRNIGKMRSDIGITTMVQNTEMICDDWISLVNKKDTVFIHGDASFDLEGYSIFAKLPGNKKLILGNHDLGNIPMGIFEKIYGCVKYKEFWLTHIPVHPFEFKTRRVKYNIHAHTHMDNIIDFEKRYINVSCEYLYSLIKHFMIKHEVILSTLDDLNKVTYV